MEKRTVATGASYLCISTDWHAPTKPMIRSALPKKEGIRELLKPFVEPKVESAGYTEFFRSSWCMQYASACLRQRGIDGVRLRAWDKEEQPARVGLSNDHVPQSDRPMTLRSEPIDTTPYGWGSAVVVGGWQGPTQFTSHAVHSLARQRSMQRKGNACVNN